MPNLTTIAGATAGVVTTGAAAVGATLAFPEKVKNYATMPWKGMQVFRTEIARPILINVSHGIQGIQSYIAKNLIGSEALGQVTRTVATVSGTDIPVHVVGTGAVLGGLAACPIAGAVYKGCKRFLKGRFQIRTNNQVLAEVSRLPECQAQKKIEILKERAQVLEERSIAQREAASCSIGKWGIFKYVMTFAAPVLATPQVAVIASVVTTVCPALVLKGIVASLAVGTALCAIRFVSARFDAYREKCQAATTMAQATELKNKALDMQKGVDRFEEIKAKADEDINGFKAAAEEAQAQVAQLQQEHAAALQQLTLQFHQIQQQNQALLQQNQQYQQQVTALIQLLPAQNVVQNGHAGAVNQPAAANPVANNDQVVVNAPAPVNDNQAVAQPNNGDANQNHNGHAPDANNNDAVVAPVVPAANQVNLPQVAVEQPVAQPAANQVAADNGNRRYWLSPLRMTDWVFGW